MAKRHTPTEDISKFDKIITFKEKQQLEKWESDLKELEAVRQLIIAKRRKLKNTLWKRKSYYKEKPENWTDGRYKRFLKVKENLNGV